IEAKTRELIARRTTPLLEYIRNRKLEKQRIREEKREERRRRELEKKRLREEEKRKKREEERCKRKEADRQKRAAEREVRIKLLKKPEKGEEPTEKPKERHEEVDIGDGIRDSLEEPREKSQNDSDKEQREMERRFREKEPETQRCHMDDSRKHRAHCEFDKFSRRNEEEPKWGKGVPPDRGKKGSQDSGIPVEAAERPGREHRSESGPAPKAERPGNKDRPALQLYQPGARIRARETGGGTSVEGRDGSRGEAEDSAWAGPQKSEEAG
uniref:Uncharacterized protein n=1 Tax=Ursus americanus TaxID=9643 RepID=A0A452RIZ3_URSAM